MSEILIANLTDISGFSTNSVSVTGTSYSTTVPGIFYVTPGGAFSFILPAIASVTVGAFFLIKDVAGLAASLNITISATGGTLIDGASTKVINTAYGALMVASNALGTWSIVGKV